VQAEKILYQEKSGRHHANRCIFFKTANRYLLRDLQTPRREEQFLCNMNEWPDSPDEESQGESQHKDCKCKAYFAFCHVLIISPINNHAKLFDVKYNKELYA
jgi:hypothetical protein